jgi:hypothetical protein
MNVLLLTAHCIITRHTVLYGTTAPRPTSVFLASFNGSIMFIFFKTVRWALGPSSPLFPAFLLVLSFFLFLSFLVFLGNQENGQKGHMVHAWKSEFPLFFHQCCCGTSVNSQSIHTWQQHGNTTAPQQ